MTLAHQTTLTRQPSMADPHTRYRKFNTSVTYLEQNLDNDLCQAVATRGGRTL